MSQVKDASIGDSANIAKICTAADGSRNLPTRFAVRLGLTHADMGI
jgi:hypothetical protein